MTRPLGSVDFFVLEAGDCLNRIEQLVAAFETPPADELLRAARALRGAAVLAQQAEIAEAAAGFESVGRALRDGLVWDGQRRQRTHQAAESFRLVVRAAPNWTDADAERARSVGRILASVAGRDALPAPLAPTVGSSVLSPGVRTFIAREGALVASALAEAARRLRESPDENAALAGAARRLLALRGMGEVRELSPLPELLDAVELLAEDLPRIGAPPLQLAGIADAAAAALARVCREVAGEGRPAPEAPDARHVVSLIFEACAVERDVVIVESLVLGDLPPIVQPADDGRAPMGALPLVSLGEHLMQTADVLARTPRPIQRELRSYGAVVLLRRTAQAGGAPALGLRTLHRGLRRALAAGLLRDNAPRLAAALREAASLLRQVADATDRRMLGRQLMQIGQRLEESAVSGAVAAGVAPVRRAAESVAATSPIVPIASLAPDADESPIVPIANLAPDAVESPIVPIATLAPDSEPTAIASPALDTSAPDLLLDTWRDYEAILAAQPIDPPAPPVPIASLEYRGAAALARAREVARLLGVSAAPATADLLAELHDLLVLADADA